MNAHRMMPEPPVVLYPTAVACVSLSESCVLFFECSTECALVNKRTGVRPKMQPPRRTRSATHKALNSPLVQGATPLSTHAPEPDAQHACHQQTSRQCARQAAPAQQQTPHTLPPATAAPKCRQHLQHSLIAAAVYVLAAAKLAAREAATPEPAAAAQQHSSRRCCFDHSRCYCCWWQCWLVVVSTAAAC